MLSLFLALEVVLTCIAVAAAYSLPNVASRWLGNGERFLQKLAARRGLAVITVGVLALAARAALLPILPIPEPTVHDEFSFLLAADTFAHGRLANPTHPMWEHFESFHINQKPTYGSMYYPAQGLLLAVGKVFFGHPFVAIWLSAGLMCAAICWMLQAWVPPKWALLGGFLAILRLGTFSYWANSYYGGTLAAIGGALVLGALPRIKRRQSMKDALLMAIGLAIIANTRPFEGFFFGVPVAVALLAWMLGKKSPRLQIAISRIVLPIGLVLLLTMAGMGYYFWRTTGTPFRIPYQINVETYGLLYFPWQQPTTPEFHHAAMRDFYAEHSLQRYRDTLAQPYEKAALGFVILWLFFVGPVLTLPFLTWFAGARFVSRKTLFLVGVCLFTALGMLVPIYPPQPHYAAPLTCAVYALVLQAMRHTRLWRWNGRPSGDVIVLAIPIICLALFGLRAGIPASGFPVTAATPRVEFFRTWFSPRYINLERARVQEELSGQAGPHLVIVRYGTQHDVVLNEWVYNGADIDNAKVVWAREMSKDKNRNLIQYFKNRSVWLCEADEKPAKMSPYPSD